MKIVYAIASAAWDKAGGDVVAAERYARAALREAKNEEALTYELIDLVRFHFRTFQSHDRCGTIRGFVPLQPGETSQPGAALERSLGKDVSLMDTPIGGKPLRDFTKAELAAHAEQQIRAGTTTLEHGHWLRNVAGLLKRNGDVVGKVLQEADLERTLRRTVERLRAATGAAA